MRELEAGAEAITEVALNNLFSDDTYIVPPAAALRCFNFSFSIIFPAAAAGLEFSPLNPSNCGLLVE